MTIPIGQGIRAARKSRNMTQKTLAKKSGVDRTYISQIENGNITPRLERIEEISAAMKMTLSQMFHLAEQIAEGNVVPRKPYAQFVMPVAKMVQ